MTDTAMLERMIAMGDIDPECPTCEAYGLLVEPRTMAPRHNASARCASGKRAHCTCDTCF